jgi:hypothetical protein
MYDQDEAFESEIYYDREPASAAVERLHGLGYGRDDISVMMDDKTREKAFSAVVNAKGSEGVAAGATIGGVLGAIVAGLTATGSVVAIAGTGGLATPLVVGPLAAALAGLGAGAAGGGIVGGLIGVGIGEKLTGGRKPKKVSAKMSVDAVAASVILKEYLERQEAAGEKA